MTTMLTNGHFEMKPTGNGEKSIWPDVSYLYKKETGEKQDGFLACNFCKQVWIFKMSSGTTTIMTHLNKKHLEPKSTEQPAITRFIANENVKISQPDSKSILDACVAVSTKNLRPFQALVGEEMTDLLHVIWSMGAKYGAISRDQLTKIIPSPQSISRRTNESSEKKKMEMKEVLVELATNKQKLSFTTDTWTDNLKRNGFLSLTVHFCKPDSQKMIDQVIELKVLRVDGKKDSSYIRRKINEILEFYGLLDNIKDFVFITDRGGNIKKALRDCTRLNCFPHFCNNIIRAACQIDTVKATIKNCNAIVRYFKFTGLNNLLKTSFKTAVDTRFNSNMMMFNSLITNWRDIESILRQKNELERMDDLDVELIKILVEYLKEFKTWSDFTDASHKPSLSLMWIAIDRFIRHSTPTLKDNHILSGMKLIVLE